MNKKILHQIKLLSAVIATITFVVLLWYILFYSLGDYHKKIVDTWCLLQENSVSETIQDITTASNNNSMIELLKNRESFSEKSYFVLYENLNVVFEKSSIVTQKYAGKSVLETYGTYSYEGGYHLSDVFERMEQGETGSDYFVKIHQNGKEYISWKNFNVGASNYILGIVTPENYILNLYKFDNLTYNTYTCGIIITFFIVLLCFVVVFNSTRYNKDIKAKTQEITTKSQQVISLTQRLTTLEDKFKNLSICDLLTGIYNRKFFDALMAKMNIQLFLPLSVGLLDINGLHLINSAFGYQTGDEVLCKIADFCKENCNDKDTLARYGNDEFVILMVNTDNEEANEKLKNIQDSVNEYFNGKMPVTISYGIETKENTDDNVYNTIITAQKNLGIDKLNAMGSSASGSVNILRNLLTQKTSETEEHCARMKEWASKLGVSIGLNQKKIEEIELLAYLHDVGKIAIPDNILNKEGRLTNEEMAIMRTHPERGYNIAMSSADLKVIAKPILQHHEKYDGTGYPNGIKGEEITLEARIISIVDAFDAMISKRVYHDSRGVDYAISELKRCRGTQFDPELTDLFVEILEKEYNIN